MLLCISYCCCCWLLYILYFQFIVKIVISLGNFFCHFVSLAATKYTWVYRWNEHLQTCQGVVDDDDGAMLLIVLNIRHIELEARRLLKSPEDILPCFQHLKSIVSVVQQELEEGPKVLLSFWVPPPNTFLNMSSQQLSETDVEVTKAVLDWVFNALSPGHQVIFSAPSEMACTCLTRKRLGRRSLKTSSSSSSPW